jgi:hypothetical protein
MNCIHCHDTIPGGRLEFILEYNRTPTCVKCTTEQRAIGYMDYGHKTAPQLVLCPSNATETRRILNRANRRAR